jgi:hypothetical protein
MYIESLKFSVVSLLSVVVLWFHILSFYFAFYGVFVLFLSSVCYIFSYFCMFLMSCCRGKRNKSSVETQLIFSFSKALATCFGLNQSIIRPLYKTNSRYNVMACQHNVLSLCSFVESHITVIIKIVRVKDPLLYFLEGLKKAFCYISQTTEYVVVFRNMYLC